MKFVKNAVVALGAAILVAGCSNSTSGSAVSESSGGTTDNEAQRDIGKTAWYDGFEITVGQVTATRLADSQVEIEIGLTYKNLINAAHSPGMDTNGNETGRVGHLEWDNGQSSDVEFQRPKVAGQATATDTAKREITNESGLGLDELLDSMSLVYGEAGTNQSKIPFAASGSVESEEPRGIPAGQSLGTNPSLQLVSAYLWPSYGEGEDGKHELWIEYSFSCDAPCGEIFYGPQSWTVTAPNGTTMTMDDRSPTVYEVPGPDDTRGQNYVIFVLDDETSGTFTVNVRGSQEEVSFDETTELTL